VLNVVHENKFDEIFLQTVRDMQQLNTYKDEFSPVIVRYAEMRVQLELLMERWYQTGCLITEEYTNKAGATNNRKTALYQSIEGLRKEIFDMENALGLTPSGLKRLYGDGVQKQAAPSKLEEALNRFG
jgi:murein L,D-transpeptidase YcbB/YkuD